MSEPIRIQKVLADAGVASRRASELLVVAGRVKVNGEVATVGQRVDAARDMITLDGRPLAGRSARVYLALNKPAGVTSTVSDRHAARTVVELIPESVRGTAERIYPVGRLDRESEGLLLLTNDGAWAQSLLHPRHEVEREYAIGVGQPLERREGDALAGGIALDEGTARLFGLRAATPTEVRRLATIADPPDRPIVWYRAVLRQGWKRQLRRMFAAVGVPVERLIRVRVGTLRLESLRPGESRALSAAERGQLVSIAGSGSPRPGSDPGPGAGRSGLVVSLDGPGSSGKSTVGAGAALALGYRFCDTGVLYRALTWLALVRGADPDVPGPLVALVPEIALVPDDVGRLRHVQVGGEDVTDRLHSPEVDRAVSRVSRHGDVRAALLPLQRGLASRGRIIMAGRDIGTVVLPDADLKLYIDVSLEERARRRASERGLDPAGPEAADVLAELGRRDGIDSTRAVAPLRIPDGATVIQSDVNTLEQTVEAVVSLIRARERPSSR
ncbi:MAG: (d)CMP kinase [Chloroflexi bacterium]|nr:(d)CMP kinase [Chloroflexota bacterium]